MLPRPDDEGGEIESHSPRSQIYGYFILCTPPLVIALKDCSQDNYHNQTAYPIKNRQDVAPRNSRCKWPPSAYPIERLTDLQTSLHNRLPASAMTMFEAKAAKKLSFEAIAKEVGRDEVAIAAMFYGQARATEEDIAKLSKILGVEHGLLTQQLAGFPDRGRTIDMPPKEPLIYRLYEIVQNYGYAYKVGGQP